jgi:hypothetical protein
MEEECASSSISEQAQEAKNVLSSLTEELESLTASKRRTAPPAGGAAVSSHVCVIDDEDQEDDDEQVISWTEQKVQDGRRSDKGERGVVFLDDDVDDEYQGWRGVFLDASSGRCEKEADVCLMEDCDTISDTWQCRHCTLINTTSKHKPSSRNGWKEHTAAGRRRRQADGIQNSPELWTCSACAASRWAGDEEPTDPGTKFTTQFTCLLVQKYKY